MLVDRAHAGACTTSGTRSASSRSRSATSSPRTARSKAGSAGSRPSTPRSCRRLAGEYRLSWLVPLVDQDRAARREIRRLERDIDQLLDEHGTTLRDEPGIGPIAAATLLCEVGDPFRFARESKFARWCGTGAVALSSGEGDGRPVKHRLDFRGNRRINSVLYIASVTQATRPPTTPAPTSTANSPKARPDEKPDEPTNATSPTASSDACGKTKHAAENHPSTRGLTRERLTVPSLDIARS